jgi:hypothetical protein
MMNKSVFALLAILLAPVCIFAVDGQTLINQSTVMSAGGFPYTITQAGSYKLSGNLIVPNGNVSAIMIAHDDVTLDLNGFSIIGPVDCSVTSNPCANSGPQMGHGIVAGTDLPVQGYFNITVRNGIISGVGADGVHLLGDSIRVEDLRIRNTGLSGGVAYSGNTLMNNNSLGVLGGVQVTGGFNMGQNFCNNAVCP